MKIVKIEDLHADAGWRTFSFLKLTTDEGLVGWSEFNEAQWNPGLTAVIRRLAEHALGQDPRAVGRLSATLAAMTRMAPVVARAARTAMMATTTRISSRVKASRLFLR